MSEVLESLTLASLPAIKQPLDAGLFCGVITLPDGKHYAVVLLADQPAKRLPLQAAMDWAEGLGAVLPTRPVYAMLFANARDQFAREWHWTSETAEADGSSAWYQTFDYGYQSLSHKSYEGRARAVRLIQLDA